MKYWRRPRRGISFTVFFACFGLACSGSLRSQEEANPAPADAEPAAGEPVATEPVSAEPVSAEPVATEPVSAEPAAAEPAAAELLDRFAASVNDLEAAFERTVRDVYGELVEDPAAGQFLLLRPDRFLWHETTPFEQILVADGEMLWTYDVELEQAMREPLASLDMTPAMLLAGSGDLGEHFLAERVPSEDGLRWLELAPVDAADSDFVSASIAFDEQDVPVVLEIVDGLGNTTRIEFIDVAINSGISPERFEFEPPAGVHVVGSDD